jgi:(S)-2-hydroxy-acid oxidase
MTAEDTLLAMSYKVDGIIISNHGGRQLDGSPATLDALVECVDAAKGSIPIHVDGGFRRGSDIFKALALGADCCWVGRVALWGLAVCLVHSNLIFTLLERISSSKFAQKQS